MAFAGETVRIISRIKDYDGNVITGSSGVTVTLDLYKPDKTHLSGPHAMVWNATGDDDGPYWYFDWDSGVNVAATYRSKVTAAGGTPVLDAWEFGRVRLQKNPL